MMATALPLGRGGPALRRLLAGAAVACCIAVPPASAFEALEMRSPDLSGDLRRALEGSSLLYTIHRENRELAADEVVATARAEYGRLIGVLYEAGHYAPTIRIRLDGVEAAVISPLEAPQSVRQVVIDIDPGPAFDFGVTRIGPLPPGAEPVAGFRTGELAQSGILRDAAQSGIQSWRDVGHPRARVTGQEIIADHRARRLDAAIRLDPGPALGFGALRVDGTVQTRVERVRAIAGIPAGEPFDPQLLERAAERLRRTGTFASVALVEADEDNPDGTVDIEATLVEAPLRRIGFGAEYDSDVGVRLSAYWMHRNLFGGAERLRIDGAVDGIGAQVPNLDTLEFYFAARYTRPATFTPDTDLTLSFLGETVSEVGYDAWRLHFDVGLAHVFSPRLTGEAALAFRFERVTDALGSRNYSAFALPSRLIWDNRNDRFDPSGGMYVSAGATPFLGLGDTGSGIQLRLDARSYIGFGGGSTVLAGRAQLGGVIGPDICATPREFLFYSGGGGTVRGHPFRSLGATTQCDGTMVGSGGQGFAALSAELRQSVTETIGVVAFFDTGFVSEGLFDGPSEWQSGAGLGLRYNTPIGPVRLDVALPVAGSTGAGTQIYLGIGQTF